MERNYVTVTLCIAIAFAAQVPRYLYTVNTVEEILSTAHP